MKLISYIYFFAICLLSTSADLKAAGAVKNFNDQIKSLVDKNYTFYAFRGSNIFYLTGHNRFLKVSFEEFYDPRSFKKFPDPINPNGITKDIIYFHKQKYSIVLRKDQKFFILQKGKLVSFNPSQNLENFGVDTKVKSELVEKTHCKYCTFKLSANYVTLDDVAQYNAEIAWLPYYRLTDTTGLRFSLGASPYYIENNDLEEVLSIGVKAQVLARQYLWNIFVELGGGTHYFVEYQDFSTTITTGIGYTFATKHWFWNEAINFNSIYFHASTVNWKQRINEAKLGIGFSF